MLFCRLFINNATDSCAKLHQYDRHVDGKERAYTEVQ